MKEVGRAYIPSQIYITVECDCGGSMISDGVTLLTDPAQYSHTCNQCGKKVSLMGNYPSLSTVSYHIGEVLYVKEI